MYTPGGYKRTAKGPALPQLGRYYRRALPARRLRACPHLGSGRALGEQRLLRVHAIVRRVRPREGPRPTSRRGVGAEVGWTLTLRSPENAFRHEGGTGAVLVFSVTPTKILAFAKGTCARHGTGSELLHPGH